MIIDYVLQPGIQIIFVLGILFNILLLFTRIKVSKPTKLILHILGGLGIYHYFILPIIFVHEFGAYEGLDYRDIFKGENGEPKYSNIVFRRDKDTALGAVSGLVKYIKKNHDETTTAIIQGALGLRDIDRVKVLAEKIDDT